MDQQDKNELNQLMERYMALWHETDDARRREMIGELWTEDGAHFISTHEYHGYRELEERVSGAYEEFVEKGGFVFRLSGEAEAHHHGVTFSWEMVPANGTGEVAATGLVFLLLNDEGRILLDYQF
jgi:hypothetical protein